MNNNYTLTLTNSEAMTIAIVTVAVIIGLVVSFIVAYINHRYTLSQGKRMATKALHLLLVLITAAFTGLQYYIPVLQQHLRVLESWPYIGGYAVGIYAAANFVYAMKAKSWFQAVLQTAQKLDAKLNNVPTVIPAPLPTPPLAPNQTESAADFQVN